MPDTAFDPVAHGWQTFADPEFQVSTPNFIDLVGPIWTRSDSGPKRVFGLLVEAKHGNRSEMAHGGMMMTFIDHSLGITSWEANGKKGQVTIQLSTQFVSGVQIGEFLEAHCEVVRKTRSITFMRATCLVGSRVCATADGVWKLRERA